MITALLHNERIAQEYDYYKALITTACKLLDRHDFANVTRKSKRAIAKLKRVTFQTKKTRKHKRKVSKEKEEEEKEEEEEEEEITPSRAQIEKHLIIIF